MVGISQFQTADNCDANDYVNKSACLINSEKKNNITILFIVVLFEKNKNLPFTRYF